MLDAERRIILLIETDEGLAQSVIEWLWTDGYQIDAALSLDQATTYLKEERAKPAAVIVGATAQDPESSGPLASLLKRFCVPTLLLIHEDLGAEQRRPFYICSHQVSRYQGTSISEVLERLLR